MRLMNIVCIGEALIDFKDRGRLAFQGYVGGSPLNAAVSASRLGGAVGFASRVSTDLFGTAIVEHLRDNGVDTTLVERSDDPSTLAFVSERGGENHFSFLDSGAADTHYDPKPRPRLPDTVRFVQFGSISLLHEPTASSVSDTAALHLGRATTVFDPNIRPALIPDREAYLERLGGWLALATLVKVSDQDLRWLAPDTDPLTTARDWLARGPEAVVVTRGREGAVLLRLGRLPIEVAAPAVEVADTVGAGDIFTGALMVALAEASSPLEELSGAAWLVALRLAATAATLSCTREGADPPSREEVDSYLRSEPDRGG
ncbi:MAG: carbohydrate kinase [Truepera sp.]|nr:carbohydrate kinase [Truepera sp.]